MFCVILKLGFFFKINTIIFGVLFNCIPLYVYKVVFRYPHLYICLFYMAILFWEILGREFLNTFFFTIANKEGKKSL